MKTLILLLPVLISVASAAPTSTIISQKDLETIEAEVQSKLNSSLVDDSKKFLINILAGRELYQYRFYDKSKQYYQNAINLNVKDNKAEAYINLMAIASFSGNKEELKNQYDASLKYFNSNRSYKTKEIEYYLSSVETSLTGKGKVSGFYGFYSNESALIDAVKNKEFEKGLSMINPEGLKGSQDNLNIVTYDALNVAVNKKKVKKSLLCS